MTDSIIPQGRLALIDIPNRREYWEEINQMFRTAEKGLPKVMRKMKPFLSIPKPKKKRRNKVV